MNAPGKNSEKLSLVALQEGAKLHEVNIEFGENMIAEADKLQTYLETTYGADKLAACSACGYGTIEADMKCPFCGEEFTTEPPEDVAPPPPPPETTEKKGKEKAPAPVKKKGKKKGKKKAPAPVKKTKAPKKTKASVEEPKVELVVTELMIEEAAQVVEIVKAKLTNTANEAYDIGLELRKIQASPGWIKARHHKNFEEFLEKEFSMAARSGRNYMAITYLDRETVLAIGPAKAYEVAALAEKQQPKVVEKIINENLSTRDLKQYLRGRTNTSSSSNTIPFETKITIAGRAVEGPIDVDFDEDKDGQFICYEFVSGYDLTLKPRFDDGVLLGLTIQVTRVVAGIPPADATAPQVTE